METPRMLESSASLEISGMVLPRSQLLTAWVTHQHLVGELHLRHVLLFTERGNLSAYFFCIKHFVLFSVAKFIFYVLHEIRKPIQIKEFHFSPQEPGEFPPDFGA